MSNLSVQPSSCHHPLSNNVAFREYIPRGDSPKIISALLGAFPNRLDAMLFFLFLLYSMLPQIDTWGWVENPADFQRFRLVACLSCLDVEYWFRMNQIHGSTQTPQVGTRVPSDTRVRIRPVSTSTQSAAGPAGLVRSGDKL